jgi:hypothetical protein
LSRSLALAARRAARRDRRARIAVARSVASTISVSMDEHPDAAVEAAG